MSETYDTRKLENKGVLITGAAGFFGSWMARGLKGKCNLYLSNRFTPIVYNNYDYIFHFAPTPIEPVIECAKRSGAKVLYASSGAVYGGLQKKVSEDCETNPVTEYGKEKLRCENILQNSGLDYCIARLFTFCGTGMKNQFAITRFTEAKKQNKPLTVMSDSTRTYMYIQDAIDWLIVLMQSENGIYNVGSETEITIPQLAHKISDNVVRSSKPFIDNAPYYVPDCSKAHSLGLIEKYNLDYGIERMLE